MAILKWLGSFFRVFRPRNPVLVLLYAQPWGALESIGLALGFIPTLTLVVNS